MSFGNLLFPMLYIRPASLNITFTIYLIYLNAVQCIENNHSNNPILRRSQIACCALLTSFSKQRPEYICGGSGGKTTTTNYHYMYVFSGSLLMCHLMLYFCKTFYCINHLQAGFDVIKSYCLMLLPYVVKIIFYAEIGLE